MGLNVVLVCTITAESRAHKALNAVYCSKNQKWDSYIPVALHALGVAHALHARGGMTSTLLVAESVRSLLYGNLAYSGDERKDMQEHALTTLLSAEQYDKNNALLLLHVALVYAETRKVCIYDFYKVVQLLTFLNYFRVNSWNKQQSTVTDRFFLIKAMSMHGN